MKEPDGRGRPRDDRESRETRRLLAGIQIFKGLDAGALDSAAEAAQEVHKDRGEVLFRQDQEARRWFVLLRGRIRVTQITPDGQQLAVRYVGPGEVFGCAPLFGGSAYPATATAVTRCLALAWDRPASESLMRRWPAVAMNALTLLGQELAQIRARYRELATERVERRIARTLLRLAKEAGTATGEGVLIAMPLSRQDIAELAGTTLHTVSRTLSGWETKGLVASGRRRVLVRDLRGLTAVAEEG